MPTRAHGYADCATDPWPTATPDCIVAESYNFDTNTVLDNITDEGSIASFHRRRHSHGVEEGSELARPEASHRDALSLALFATPYSLNLWFCHLAYLGWLWWRSACKGWYLRKIPTSISLAGGRTPLSYSLPFSRYLQ